MVNITKIIIASIILIFISACCKKDSYVELTLPKENYTANNLRLDGYYYSYFDNPKGTHIFFLYNNGVFQHIFTSSDTALIKIDNYLNSLNRGSFRDSYGLFQVSGKNIKIERWVLSQECKQPTYLAEGQITNDTTIKINLTSFNDLYKFHRFVPKLDSTNNFIK